MYPLKTEDMIKLKWQNIMQKKRLPATADRAVWRAGIMWAIVVEKVGKDVGGNQEKILSKERFAGYKTETTEKKTEIKARLALRNEVKEEVKGRNRNENVFARPNGLREKR